jgi:hypothetical protein
MHAAFGEPPPVTTDAELSVVAPIATTRSGATGVRRRGRALPVLAGTAVVALVLGAWAFGRAGATASQPAGQPERAPVIEVEPAAPATASAPLVVPSPVVVPPPVAAAPVEPQPKPPAVASERKPTREKSRARKDGRRKPPPQADAGLGDLYPPGHPR